MFHQCANDRRLCVCWCICKLQNDNRHSCKKSETERDSNPCMLAIILECCSLHNRALLGLRHSAFTCCYFAILSSFSHLAIQTQTLILLFSRLGRKQFFFLIAAQAQYLFPQFATEELMKISILKIQPIWLQIFDCHRL